MIDLVNYIKYYCTPDPFISDKRCDEMATIGYPVLGKTEYHIAIHGPDSGDRENPHIHIYLGSDRKPFNQFNFEISLTDIVSKDEINIIKQDDKKNKIRRNNRNKCSWDGYSKMKYDFEDWLDSDNVEIPGEWVNNLHAIIWWYNQESRGTHSKNYFLDYCNNHGIKILDKYKDIIEQSTLK